MSESTFRALVLTLVLNQKEGAVVSEIKELPVSTVPAGDVLVDVSIPA